MLLLVDAHTEEPGLLNPRRCQDRMTTAEIAQDPILEEPEGVTWNLLMAAFYGF